MSKYQEKAVDLFNEGYNCAQATVATFHQEMGCDERHAIRISSAFGGGMGRMGEVCGALTGAFMAIGAIKGNDDPTNKQAKDNHYELIQKIARKFEEKNGSILCRELLKIIEENQSPISIDGKPRKKCEHLVRYAVLLVENEMVSK